MNTKPIVVAFVQARMSSTRFPGKVMEKIGDKTVIETTAGRLRASSSVDHVVVITTNNPADDAIVRHCEERAIAVFRGSEDDVMKRLVDASGMVVCDVIVDVTADCPLVDPSHVDDMVRKLTTFDLDYCSNVMTRTWPDGLDVQVYTRRALIRLVSEHDVISEHTGWNFIPHKDDFRCLNVSAPKEYECPDWALTLDHPEDLELLRLLFRVGRLADPDEDGIVPDSFRVEKALDFLNEFPWLLKINEGKERRSISHETYEEGER